MRMFPPATVLLPTDGSERSLAAVRIGLIVAAKAHAQARVLRVLPQHDPDVQRARTPEDGEDRLAFERDLLSDLVHGLAGPDTAVSVEVVRGATAPAILEAQAQHDLTLMGTRGRGGAAGFPLGSVTERVLTYTHGPLWVVHPETPWRLPRRILLATDGTWAGQRAVDEGLAWAALWDAEVTLLYVMEDIQRIVAMAPSPASWYNEAQDLLRAEGERALQDAADRAARAGVPATSVLRTGSPGAVIEREAETYDLLVMGAHTLGQGSHFPMGSVCGWVTRHVDVPYLVVPEPPPDRATAQGEPAR